MVPEVNQRLFALPPNASDRDPETADFGPRGTPYLDLWPDWQ